MKLASLMDGAALRSATHLDLNRMGGAPDAFKVGTVNAGKLAPISQVMESLAGTGAHHFALKDIPVADAGSPSGGHRAYLNLVRAPSGSGEFMRSNLDALSGEHAKPIQLANAGKSDAVIDRYYFKGRQEIKNHFVLKTSHEGSVQIDSGGHLEIKGVIARGDFEVHGKLTVSGGDIRLHVQKPQIGSGGTGSASEQFDSSGSAGAIEGKLFVESGAKVSIDGAFMGQITVAKGGTLTTGPGSLVIGKIINQGGSVTIGGVLRGYRTIHFERQPNGSVQESRDKTRNSEFSGEIKFLEGAKLDEMVVFKERLVRGSDDD